jgi:hypothetical protein
MKVLDKQIGVLKVLVASEGKFIREGTNVVIETIVDNFKNIEVHVISPYTMVRLPYIDTDINWLLGVK